jgi:hypothetical protein
MSNWIPILVIIVFAQSCHHKTSVKNEVDHIRVTYVDIELLTSIHVDCQNFNEYFSGTKKTIELDQNGWYDLKEELDQLITTGRQFSEGADTRIVVEVYGNEKKIIETYCIGNTVLTVSGRNYIMDDRLRSFLTGHVLK